MKILFKILNIIYGLYFFLFFNFLFWLSLLGLVFGKQSGNNFFLYFNLIMGPLYMLACIMFFKRSKTRYIIGLSFLFIDLIVSQVGRLLFITNMRLEVTDFTNLLFYGIPFIVLLISLYFDKSEKSGMGEGQIPVPQNNNIQQSPVSSQNDSGSVNPNQAPILPEQPIEQLV